MLNLCWKLPPAQPHPQPYHHRSAAYIKHLAFIVEISYEKPQSPQENFIYDYYLCSASSLSLSLECWLLWDDAAASVAVRDEGKRGKVCIWIGIFPWEVDWNLLLDKETMMLICLYQLSEHGADWLVYNTNSISVLLCFPRFTSYLCVYVWKVKTFLDTADNIFTSHSPSNWQ